jgi:hypothetical protein
VCVLQAKHQKETETKVTTFDQGLTSAFRHLSSVIRPPSLKAINLLNEIKTEINEKS